MWGNVCCGTELPIPNISSSAAMEGKADKICSMRVLRILTPTGHERPAFAAMHGPDLLYLARDL
jgi:hypothetical protein